MYGPHCLSLCIHIDVSDVEEVREEVGTYKTGTTAQTIRAGGEVSDATAYHAFDMHTKVTNPVVAQKIATTSQRRFDTGTESKIGKLFWYHANPV